MMSIYLSVCRQNVKNAIFSKTKQFRSIDDHRKLCKLNWAFQRTHYWIPTIQDGSDTPSWKSTWRYFFLPRVVDLDKISETVAEWHVDCGDVWKWKPEVEFQYGRRLCEFNGIPEPRITLQVAATWWIHCHDSRATCHIAGRSHLTKSMSWSCHIAGCKNSIRHIENRFSPYFIFFLFLMQFRLLTSGGFRIVSDTLVTISSGWQHINVQNISIICAKICTKLN